MLISIIRVTVILLVLLLVLRIMGKKTMGEMQPFEFVITLAIAELACVPMSDATIPIFYGLIPVLTVCVLHFVLALLSRKSTRLRKLFNGSNVVVITPNGIEQNALKKLNMSAEELLDSCAAQGYFSLEDVHTAYFQTNGALTVIPTAKATPPTLGDLGVSVAQATYPLILVEDGKLANLEKFALSREQAQDILSKCGAPDLKKIVLACADLCGNLYLKTATHPYTTHRVEALMRGGVSAC